MVRWGHAAADDHRQRRRVILFPGAAKLRRLRVRLLGDSCPRRIGQAPCGGLDMRTGRGGQDGLWAGGREGARKRQVGLCEHEVLRTGGPRPICLSGRCGQWIYAVRTARPRSVNVRTGAIRSLGVARIQRTDRRRRQVSRQRRIQVLGLLVPGLRAARGFGRPGAGAGHLAPGLGRPGAGIGDLRVRIGPGGQVRAGRHLRGSRRIPAIPFVATAAPVGAITVVRPVSPVPLWRHPPGPGPWVRPLIRVGRPAGVSLLNLDGFGLRREMALCARRPDVEPAQRAEPFLGRLAVLAGLGGGLPAAPTAVGEVGAADGEHGEQRNAAPQRADGQELAGACYPVPAMPRRQSHSLTNESIFTPQMSNAVPMIVKHEAAGTRPAAV